MRRFLPLCLALAAIGCSSEPVPKPDTAAPAVSYQMVPATTGGTGSSATPPPAAVAAPPTGKPGNPPSVGSD